MAKTLVDMLTANFDPSRYRDEYRDALMGTIQLKAQGAEIAQPPPTKGKTVDLMAALRASIQDVKEARAAKKPTKIADERAAMAQATRRRKAV